MEATMYDDNSSMESSSKKRKMNMTLDLQQSIVKPKQEKLLAASDLLATPDIGMFMLASPDLERFMVQQQNGLVLTTPTPTSHVLFPKSVTEEQEAYARGFIDALAELHKSYGTTAVSSSSTSAVTGGTVGGITTTAMPLTSKTVVLTAANPMAANYVFAAQSSTQSPVRARLPTMITVANSAPAVKIESAQTVPAVATLPLPSSSSVIDAIDMKPIDMDEQETVKLERKRARNRLAATRCRNRKLERISRLEERVAELKSQNNQLVQSAAALREEVSRLKRGIVEHTRRGCQVMLSHSLM